VVDIGRSIVDSLFPSVDPSANRFRLDGRLYEVIGAFEPDRGLFSNFGVDQFACIHVSNFRKTLPEIKERFIAVAGKDRFSLTTVRDQVEQSLRRKRHVPYNVENDFESPRPTS
jgi:hypothetical protein